MEKRAGHALLPSETNAPRVSSFILNSFETSIVIPPKATSRLTRTLNGRRKRAVRRFRIVRYLIIRYFPRLDRAWVRPIFHVQDVESQGWRTDKAAIFVAERAFAFVVRFFLRSTMSQQPRFYFRAREIREPRSSAFFCSTAAFRERVSRFVFQRVRRLSLSVSLSLNEQEKKKGKIRENLSYQKLRYSRRKFAPIANRCLRDRCPIGRCHVPRRLLPRTIT